MKPLFTISVLIALDLLEWGGGVMTRLNFFPFLDLAVAKSLQSTRTVTDDDDADADDVLTTTGYTC